MSENKELTDGQKLVGYSFNPSKMPEVDEAKRIFADLIDGLHKNDVGLMQEPFRKAKQYLHNDKFKIDPEANFCDFTVIMLARKALDDLTVDGCQQEATLSILQAQMAVVKVLTWNFETKSE